jgi:hypothetical protein
MATTVEGLFNLPTAGQAGQQYYEGLLTSPGQMNNLSLMQQISALGANAGAGVGYAGGRLLGGKAPDEIRIQGVNEAMAEATKMGGSDADMYSNLAKGLAARGLTQDAMAATERARTAKRDEQAMALAASQEARAVSGEGRAVSAEERAVQEAKQRQTKFDQETKLFPNILKKSGLEVMSLEEAQRGDVGNKNYLQQAVDTGIDPNTKEALTPAQIAIAKGKIVDITTKLANTQAELNMKKEHYAAQASHWKAMEARGADANALAREKMNQENFSQPASVQVPAEYPGAPPVKMYVGAINPKSGKVRGKDGNIYDNINDAAREQGIGVAPVAATPATPAAGTPAAAPNTKPDPKSFFRDSSPASYTNPMGN